MQRAGHGAAHSHGEQQRQCERQHHRDALNERRRYGLAPQQATLADDRGHESLLDRTQAGHHVGGTVGCISEGWVLRRGATGERQGDCLLHLRLRPVGLCRGRSVFVEVTLAACGPETELGQVSLLLCLRGIDGSQLAGLELGGAHQVGCESRGEDRLLLRYLFFHGRDQAHDPDGVGQCRVVAARRDFILKRE